MDSKTVGMSQFAHSTLCRHDFGAFLRKAWPWIHGGEELVWNWHLDAVCHRLDCLYTGTSHRLVINLPPRNGKSKTVSVIWVAWMLGIDPGLNFVCVSYSNELSVKLARDCLMVMQSPGYRKIFPQTIVSRRRSAAADFETTRGGGRLATSVSGSLTGRGGDIIIIDDVIKPEDAHSENARNKVNAWFKSTLALRLNDKKSGKLLCLMPRLHQDDLSGVLMNSAVWDQLSLPAIATCEEKIPLPGGLLHHREIGDVLHPEREPLAILEQLKKTIGTNAFQAQYQQNPVPAGGTLFKSTWLSEWPEDFDPSACGEVVQSWDTAVKTGARNDFSVCITALICRKSIYILDVFRARLQFHELKAKAMELPRLHGAKVILIEDASSGAALVQSLRAEKLSGVPRLIARRPEGGKLIRFLLASAMIQARQLFLPGDANWLGDFTSELLGFPFARFDDQVDALSQLLIWAHEQDNLSAAAVRRARQRAKLAVPNHLDGNS